MSLEQFNQKSTRLISDEELLADVFYMILKKADTLKDRLNSNNGDTRPSEILLNEASMFQIDIRDIDKNNCKIRELYENNHFKLKTFPYKNLPDDCNTPISVECAIRPNRKGDIAIHIHKDGAIDTETCEQKPSLVTNFTANQSRLCLAYIDSLFKQVEDEFLYERQYGNINKEVLELISPK